MKSASGIFWAAAFAAATSGCGLPLKAPKLESVSLVSPQQAWERVLGGRIDAQGRVDFDGLRKEPQDLQNFISWIGTVSPGYDAGRFPTAASRLAYYLNAYNAMALYTVIDSDVRPADAGRFYGRVKLMIGGDLMTLEDLESAIASLKDPRAWFALCGEAKGHPRPAGVPYSVAALEAQLDQAARAFLADPRNVVVDPKRHVVRLSGYLQRHKRHLAAGAASLLAYVNRYRDDKVPESYKVEFLPFDWTLNAQKEDRPVAASGPNLH